MRSGPDDRGVQHVVCPICPANTQGITVLAASGDWGASGCDSGNIATGGLAVDFPSSLASVTGVGGTRLNEGNGSYWRLNEQRIRYLWYIPGNRLEQGEPRRLGRRRKQARAEAELARLGRVYRTTERVMCRT